MKLEINSSLIKIYHLILLLSLFSLSCTTPKPYVKTMFEGKWKEVKNEDLFGPRNYFNITFKSDSFYLQKQMETDVQNECHKTGQWMEYYSGTFKYDKDSIYLRGIRTDSLNNEAKKSECLRETNYIVSFKYEFRNDTMIFLPREQMGQNVPDSVYVKNKDRIDKDISIFMKKD